MVLIRVWRQLTVHGTYSKTMCPLDFAQNSKEWDPTSQCYIAMLYRLSHAIMDCYRTKAISVYFRSKTFLIIIVVCDLWDIFWLLLIQRSPSLHIYNYGKYVVQRTQWPTQQCNSSLDLKCLRWWSLLWKHPIWFYSKNFKALSFMS